MDLMSKVIATKAATNKSGWTKYPHELSIMIALLANEYLVKDVHVSCRHARDSSELCRIDKFGCSDGR